MGTEREQPFKELRLSAMNYVNFGKGLRGGMWMGWGSAAGINYGNVGYFAAAPAQPQCLVRIVMMMMVDGDDDGRLW